MISLSINIQENASDTMRLLVGKLKDRTELHEHIGRDLRNFVHNYVLEDEPNRHDTSIGLGANSSNFVTKAAQQVEVTVPEADTKGVTLLLPHPWFARAFHDVEITPKNGLYLTIPMIAGAYNRRAPDIDGLFFFKTRKGTAFLAKALSGGGLELWYLLVTIVHQSQDRTRLPEYQAIMQLGLDSAKDYLNKLLDDAIARSEQQDQGGAK